MDCTGIVQGLQSVKWKVHPYNPQPSRNPDAIQDTRNWKPIVVDQDIASQIIHLKIQRCNNHFAIQNPSAILVQSVQQKEEPYGIGTRGMAGLIISRYTLSILQF